MFVPDGVSLSLTTDDGRPAHILIDIRVLHRLHRHRAHSVALERRAVLIDNMVRETLSSYPQTIQKTTVVLFVHDEQMQADG